MRARLVLTMAAIATFIIGVTITTRAANALDRYPSVRSVLTIPAQEELVAVTLDSAVWAVSPGMPPDLRLADADGSTPIPHLLRKAAEQRMRTVRENCRASVEALQELPDNRIALTVVLDANSPFATGIAFTTPLQDFERQVNVQGIDADGTATILVENALIYDYARFADVRRTNVDLPPNHFRRFAIAIDNVTDQKLSPRREISRTYEEGEEIRRIDNSTVIARPFRMDSVQLYAERQAESYHVTRELPIELKSWSIRELPRQKQTLIEVETLTEPVTGFTLQIGDRNFTRRVSVEVPSGHAGSDAWQPISSATLSRIAFRNLLQEQLRVSFVEQRSPRFRLVISNQDNPPLKITGAEAFGPVWQALYLAMPGQQARLYFGAVQSTPARCDTTAIERVLANGFQPAVFSLGEPDENPHYRHQGSSLIGLIGSRAFFIATVVIMITVMAAGLVKAIRHLD